MMPRRLALPAAALAAALALTGCGASGGETTAPEAATADGRLDVASLTASGGWAKAAEIGGMTGVFGTIANDGTRDLTITGAESDAAESVELHEVTADGVMQPIAGDVVIPAGGSLELAPGADHIMLMGLQHDLLAGDDVTVTVRFDDGSSFDLAVPVKDYAGANEEYGAEGHDSTAGHEGHDAHDGH